MRSLIKQLLTEMPKGRGNIDYPAQRAILTKLPEWLQAAPDAPYLIPDGMKPPKKLDSDNDYISWVNQNMKDDEFVKSLIQVLTEDPVFGPMYKRERNRYFVIRSREKYLDKYRQNEYDRYHNDPEFRAKRIKATNDKLKQRRKTDPVFRDKLNQTSKEWRRNNKERVQWSTERNYTNKFISRIEADYPDISPEDQELLNALHDRILRLMGGK